MRDFSDENAKDPQIVALRDRVVATVDPAMKEEQVRAKVTLKDGRVLNLFVEHVVGSLERPMSDAALEGEVRRSGQGRAAGPAGAPAHGPVLEGRGAAERGGVGGCGGAHGIASRSQDGRGPSSDECGASAAW